MEATGMTIVCGVDGSDGAREALDAARRLAARLEGRLVVAHVVTPAPVAAPSPAVPAVASEGAELRAGASLLDRLCKDAGTGPDDRRLLSGRPAERLAELADEEEAELVVVGSRGRGPVRAAFLGSVSTELIGLAPCPVLVVPRGASAEAPTR
jgi:nucleotide-binding universal stress UspA family protein